MFAPLAGRKCERQVPDQRDADDPVTQEETHIDDEIKHFEAVLHGAGAHGPVEPETTRLGPSVRDRLVHEHSAPLQSRHHRLAFELARFAQRCQATADDEAAATWAFARVSNVVRRIWPEARLAVAGSRERLGSERRQLGLALPNADLDLHLVLPTQHATAEALEMLDARLLSAGVISHRGTIVQPRWAPALLKCTPVGSHVELEIQIEASEQPMTSDTERTKALYSLIAADWAVVRAILLPVKQAIERYNARLPTAYFGGEDKRAKLTGYPLLLMVLAFVHVRRGERRASLTRTALHVETPSRGSAASARAFDRQHRPRVRRVRRLLRAHVRADIRARRAGDHARCPTRHGRDRAHQGPDA